MRITGLASGMDIDSMVKDLMKARRTSLDKMFQKRTLVEWQQEAYRDVSTSIVDFRNNKLSSYSLSTNIGAKTTEVSGNTNAVTINSTSSAAAGTLNVNVQKIATVSNTVFTYDPDGNAGTVNSTAGKTLSQLGFSGTSITINNGVSSTVISLDPATDKLSDLVNKINANKTTKVTATFDDVSGKFALTNIDTGALTQTITGLPAAFTSAATIGQDAKVDINGITYQQSSNRFQVNGFDFTVKKESGSDGVSTLTAKTDTDKILNTIKSFVSDYNNLIDMVNKKLDEKQYRDFPPLTDEQKKDMKDSEIELWDQKAHSGLIRNDSILSQMTSDLRIASTANFSANYNIQTVGISTGKWYDKGKLVIEDESKLRAAIEADPQKVLDLFTKAPPTGVTPQPGDAGIGIFQKMTKITMTALTQLSDKAGTSITSTDKNFEFLENSLLSDQIRNMKRREDDETARLSDIENRYYQQFSAMEKAIQQFNSQASSLSSFMS